MLQAYDPLRAHHITPGHDPLVMRLCLAPRPEFEGIVVRSRCAEEQKREKGECRYSFTFAALDPLPSGRCVPIV